MDSNEIRRRFLEFFKKRGHAIIPSSSLVPENDPSVLFTTAGMQPLIPYLLGEKHPTGKRLVNIQKCVRTVDIDEVGDNTHLTFFEMMGNWSLGDYFKKDAIEWSYELLTSKEKGFELNPQRLYVTCFEGDENAPRDEDSAKIWKEIFEKNNITGERIYFMPAEKNWWSPGDNGPCGPDSEMFYDLTGTLLTGLDKEEFIKADSEQKIVEIWNDVFMEYQKKDGRVVGKLKQQNVDTGAGLERLAMVMQGKDNIFDTDLFVPIMTHLDSSFPGGEMRLKRVVADHIRTAVFMLVDGVLPAKQDRGSILRGLIRKAIKNFYILGARDPYGLISIVPIITNIYKGFYSFENKEHEIIVALLGEINLFESSRAEQDKILEKFEKYLKGQGRSPLEAQIGIPGQRYNVSNPFISGMEAYEMYATFGISIEDIKYLAKKLHYVLDNESFDEEIKKGKKKHQQLSRAGAEQKFKGGLMDHSPQSIKYHTATHLLHKALREVLGNHVFQKGSNITPERLRFDFSFERKMTDEEKKKVEDLVNKKIKEALPVTYEDIPLKEAQKRGAVGLFEEKYGDKVRVYKIGPSNSSGQAFSLEFCGGPHVKNTSELGTFKISKEEAVAQGIRRIKAVLE
ncbi:MAG: alanine--tRNA ligase [Patescibacteria group bacterium]